MNILVLFLILFLALAGMGTIWFIVNKAKCKLPDTSNCSTTASDDGYPQLPYCISSDAQVSCANQTKVCGAKPSCTGVLTCDYKTQKWSCTSGSGPDPGATYCTIKNGKTDKYNIFIDDKDTGSNMVDPNATQYTLTSYPGNINGCVLSGCKSTYNVSIKDTEGSGWCVSDANRADRPGCSVGSNPRLLTDTHTYTDTNAEWVNAYLTGTTDHKLYCRFNKCLTGSGDPCIASDTGCINPIVPPITKWDKSGNDCYVSDCDNTGIEQYIPDPPGIKATTCKLNACNPLENDKTFTWKIDTKTQKCIKSGCQPVYGGLNHDLMYTPVLVGESCQPDCTKDNAAINYFLTGSALTLDPRTMKPIQYFKAQLSGDTTRCNQQQLDGSIWGGCGSTDNPTYAVNPFDTRMCAQTFPTEFARYDDGLGNGTEDSQKLNSSAGCLLCGAKICPPGDTDGTTCIGDTDCGFSGITKGDKTTQGALAFCIDQVNKINPHITFNNYQASGLQDRGHNTGGYPAIYPKQLIIDATDFKDVSFRAHLLFLGVTDAFFSAVDPHPPIWNFFTNSGLIQVNAWLNEQDPNTGKSIERPSFFLKTSDLATYMIKINAYQVTVQLAKNNDYDSVKLIKMTFDDVNNTVLQQSQAASLFVTCNNINPCKYN